MGFTAAVCLSGGYDAPSSDYNAPQTSYNAPQTSYNAPQTSYNAPQTSYSSPQATYGRLDFGIDPKYQVEVSLITFKNSGCYNIKLILVLLSY